MSDPAAPGTTESDQGPPKDAELGGDPGGEAAPGTGADAKQPRQSGREKPDDDSLLGKAKRAVTGD